MEKRRCKVYEYIEKRRCKVYEYIVMQNVLVQSSKNWHRGLESVPVWFRRWAWVFQKNGPESEKCTSTVTKTGSTVENVPVQLQKSVLQCKMYQYNYKTRSNGVKCMSTITKIGALGKMYGYSPEKKALIRSVPVQLRKWACVFWKKGATLDNGKCTSTVTITGSTMENVPVQVKKMGAVGKMYGYSP